jgi:hypothetical protein
MYSGTKINKSNEEIDENVKTKGCSYIPVCWISLFTVLIKGTHDQK